MNSPICLFDSGSGGLTVLKKLAAAFPNESYIYLGDLANVPFGDKPKDKLKGLVDDIVEWLLKFNPKALIMACNTSSTLFFDEYKQNLNVPVFGMIESLAKDMAKSQLSKVSVWATNNTVQNSGYKNAIQKLNSQITVEEIACPLLVPMIENLSTENKEEVLQEYLNKTSKDTEALIWGCTHYPLIEAEFKKLSEVPTLDPADNLIRTLKDTLHCNSSTSQANISLYTTAQKEQFQKFAKFYLCLDAQIKTIKLNKSPA